jgi:hypothetical protein
LGSLVLIFILLQNQQMKIIYYAGLILLLIPAVLNAQQRYVAPGTSVVVKEISSWDPGYATKDKIIGKQAKVAGKGLAHMGDSHYGGTVVIDGTEYQLLDIKIEVQQSSTTPVVVKDKTKLESGLKELVNYYRSDFKAIKTTRPKPRPYHYAESFHSSFLLHSSKDTTNTIFYDPGVSTWNYETLMDPKLFSSKEIREVLETTTFVFGKLEKLKEEKVNDLTDIYYVPAERKKPGSKFKKLTIHLHSVEYNGKEFFIQLSMLNRTYEMDLQDLPKLHAKPPIAKDLKKLEADLKQLIGFYLQDFSTINSKRKTEDDYWGKPSYRSTFKLNGALDSAGIIYLDSATKSWNYRIDIDPEVYQSKEIDKLLQTIVFPFGKLEKEKLNVESMIAFYFPLNRNKLTNKFRDLNISVFKFESGGKETSIAITVYGKVL